MIMKEYKYVEVKFEAKGVLFHSASEPKDKNAKRIDLPWKNIQILSQARGTLWSTIWSR